MISRVAAILGSGLFLLAACAPAVTNTEPSKSVNVFSTLDLGPTGTQRFLDFQKSADFNGAMYVTRDGAGGSRQAAAPTLQEAKTIAKATCEAIAAANGNTAGCVLYATVEPADPSKTNGLPILAFQALQRAILRTSGTAHAALAMNGDGQFAAVGSPVSPEEAERLATKQCNAAALANRKSDQREARNAKDRIGAYKCRVVAAE